MKTNITKVEVSRIETTLTAADIRDLIHAPTDAEVYFRSTEELGVEERLKMDDLRQIVVTYIR